MPRWAVVTVSLVLFTLVMGAWGWLVGETVPHAVDWLRDRIGHVGLWIPLILLWLAAGVILYRSRGDKLNGM